MFDFILAVPNSLNFFFLLIFLNSDFMDLHNFIKSKVWVNFIICTYFLQLVLSGEEPRYESCKPRSCGIGPSVSYPFYIIGNGTDFCGHPRFGIQCEGGRPIYKTSGPEYILERIDYQNQSFVLVRRELSNSTCPKPLMNFAFDQSFLKFPSSRANLVFFYNCTESFTVNFPKSLVTCDDPPTEKKTYIVLLPLFGEAVWKNSTCEGVVSTPVQLDSGKENQTAADIDYKKKLKDGFGMQWVGLEFDCGACETSGGQCGYDSGSSICYCSDGSSHPNNCNKGYNRLGLKLGLGITFAAFGALMFIGFLFRDSIISCLSLCCGNGRREDHNIEDFLEHYGPLTPKRFTYLEVKKITKSFKDKLGKGGYGEVFKGNLPDGSLVAVKVLLKSKTNGEEFINEVASIGRTSHVNIVTLLGFCFEGSKRALIYEFMSGGSLDKYIYEENCSMHDRRLGWQTLFEIAIGIARGLEYLHRGCNTRILHFDIKPHNILLDENFCPKIADFGLAKICPERESVISMMGARGTAGYIAPEVFCRTIGGVSHKSDVYSYGMLVFEMVGGRKNVRVDVENISETYFPEWIHKRLELGEDLGLWGTGTNEEIQLARKMILVSLLCIQTNPSDRPPMDKVVEMLQGSLEYIPFSPKPYWSSPCITVQSSVANSTSALIVTS